MQKKRQQQMTFEPICPICKRPLNENGFCSDPECQIDCNNTCTCFSFKQVVYVKVNRRLRSA